MACGIENMPQGEVDSHIMKTEHVYCCKFPGCSRSYVSSDGVRKHCRKHHPQWLAQLDEVAKEERTPYRSELYCTKQIKRTVDEIDSPIGQLQSVPPWGLKMQKKDQQLSVYTSPLITSGSSSPTATEADDLPGSTFGTPPQQSHCAFTQACSRAFDAVPFLDLDPSQPGQLLPDEPLHSFSFGNQSFFGDGRNLLQSSVAEGCNQPPSDLLQDGICSAALSDFLDVIWA